jgi:hypothetical protein
MTAIARLMAPVTIGTRRYPSIGLLVLAAIGGSLLLIVAATEWNHLNDEYAYWLAGSRVAAGLSPYAVAAAPNTPFAYWYPPPLAQVLAPLTSLVSADAFSVAWTALLLACLWWLAGRDVLVALALIAFLPVAVELRVRNVHLVLAVLAVLAIRRSPMFWIPAAAVKVTPILGLVYLAAEERWRAFVSVAVVGALVLGVSFVAAPWLWQGFVDVVVVRAGSDGGSIVPIPFALRLTVGTVLTVIAGRSARRARRAGTSARVAEVLLIVALTIANPTLWVTALSLLVAIVPLWRTAPTSPSLASPPPALQPEVSAT